VSSYVALPLERWRWDDIMIYLWVCKIHERNSLLRALHMQYYIIQPGNGALNTGITISGLVYHVIRV
jgi:hypothetical protein